MTIDSDSDQGVDSTKVVKPSVTKAQKKQKKASAEQQIIKADEEDIAINKEF
jgi:hypothetical protein